MNISTDTEEKITTMTQGKQAGGVNEDMINLFVIFIKTIIL